MPVFLHIIEYAIINKEDRKEIKDSRIKRRGELYTEHFLVMTKLERE